MHSVKNNGSSSIKGKHGYWGKLADPATCNYTEPQFRFCEMWRIVLNDQCVVNT